MLEQVLEAAKKVTIRQALSAKPENGFFSIEGIPLKRARMLCSVIHTELSGRFIKITIDDGTGRMNVYDSKNREYSVGAIYDITALLKVGRNNLIYGIVELRVPIDRELKDILTRIRNEEIKRQKGILADAIKEEVVM